MESHDSPPKNTPGSFFTPLLISMIGILSASTALVVYHFVLVKLCLRRRQRTAGTSEVAQLPAPQVPSVTIGVDQKLLQTIPIIAYSTHEAGDDHLFRKDQSECVVCLGELERGERVRLLPNCKHAFHVPCIDEWFVAHISCPICRSPIVAENPPALENDVPTSPPPSPPPLPTSCLNGSDGVVFPSENHDAPGTRTAFTTGNNDPSSSGGNTQRFATLLSWSSGSSVLPNERTSSSTRGIAGLRRSLSLDQSSVTINIQQQREISGRHCSPSSSSSIIKDDLVESRTTGPLPIKHLDRVSSKLRTSLSRLRGKNTDTLPY